jgi:hypothetical protein
MSVLHVNRAFDETLYCCCCCATVATVAVAPGGEDAWLEKELPFFNPGLPPLLQLLSPSHFGWALAALQVNALCTCTGEVEALTTSVRPAWSKHL